MIVYYCYDFYFGKFKFDLQSFDKVLYYMQSLTRLATIYCHTSISREYDIPSFFDSLSVSTLDHVVILVSTTVANSVVTSWVNVQI